MENYHIESEKIRQKVRLVFISDLHEKCFGDGQDRLLQMIRSAEPDLILIGGDLIICQKKRLFRPMKPDQIEQSCALLQALKKEYPVYMVPGNHELRLREKAEGGEKAARENLQRLRTAMKGIRLLDGRTEELPEYGFSVSGVTLPMKYYGKLLFRQKPPLSEADFRLCGGDFPEENVFRLCLVHTPLYFREAIDYGADLVLSGHYHGGTVRLPLLGGLMTPQFQFFVKECAGRHPYGRGELIVSRGLGTHSVNLRINDRPELTVITLEPKEAAKDG